MSGFFLSNSIDSMGLDGKLIIVFVFNSLPIEILENRMVIVRSKVLIIFP